MFSTPEIKVTIYCSINKSIWRDFVPRETEPPPLIAGVGFDGILPLTLYVSSQVEAYQNNFPTNLVKSLTYNYARQSPVAELSMEMAPLTGQLDWFQMIQSNDYIRVEVDGNLEWDGLISFVGSRNEIGSGRRFTVKAKGIGVVFAQYANIIFNRAIYGVAYSGQSSQAELISKISSLVDATTGQPPLNENFTSKLWEVFFSVFKELSGGVPYTFSDGEDIERKFGVNGANFFRIASNILYSTPLYMSLFNIGEGSPSLFQLLKECVQEPFNEVFMTYVDRRIKIPYNNGFLGGNTVDMGYKFIVRRSLFIPVQFDGYRPFRIPSVLIKSSTLQKSNEEVYTGFLSSPTMANNGVSSALLSEEMVFDKKRIPRYGFKSMEIPIRSGVNTATLLNDGNATRPFADRNDTGKTGGETLMGMFGNADELLSGVLVMPYVPLRPGMLIGWNEDFGWIARGVKAMVDMVSNTYNADGNAVTTTVQFIRGKFMPQVFDESQP